MKEKPSFYAILTANVRYSDKISAWSKLLYAEITALSNKNWFCSASNKYFADLYNVDTRTIIRQLKSLKDNWFLFICIDKQKRTLSICDKNVFGGWQKCLAGGDKNVAYNNTRYNNKFNITNFSKLEEEKTKEKRKIIELKESDEEEKRILKLKNKIDLIKKIREEVWSFKIIEKEKEYINKTIENFNFIPTSAVVSAFINSELIKEYKIKNSQ
jgi:hypothetical protein